MLYQTCKTCTMSTYRMILNAVYNTTFDGFLKTFCCDLSDKVAVDIEIHKESFVTKVTKVGSK